VGGLIAALLSIELIGIFFTLLIFKVLKYETSLGELLSLAFFYGTGIIVFELFLLYSFGVYFNFRDIIVLLLALLIMTPILFVKFFPKIKYQSIKLDSWLFESLFFLILFLVIVIEIVVIIFMIPPILAYCRDSVAIYAFKAKIFYFNSGIPKDFFKWSEATVGAPGYPLLLPLIMTWVYEFTGFNDAIVSKLMPLFFCVFLIIFYVLLKKYFNRKYALLGIFLFATMPQVERVTCVILSDLILTIFVTLAFIYYMFFLKDGEFKYLIISSLLFGFSLWTKDEAILFSGVFIVSLFFYLKDNFKQKLWKYLAIAFFIIFICYLPWFLTKKFNHMVNTSDVNLSVITFRQAINNIKSLPVFLNQLRIQVFALEYWNIFWIILITAIILKRDLLFKGKNKYITLFIVMTIAAHFLAYMFIASEGRSRSILITATPRYLVHFIGCFIFLLLYLLRDSNLIQD